MGGGGSGGSTETGEMTSEAGIDNDLLAMVGLSKFKE